MDLEKENPGEFSQSTGLSSLDATPSHPKQPKRVQIEEEPKTEDKAALVLDEDPDEQQQQQRQPKPKRPVLDQPVIALQGREVLFAIAIFFLLAVVVSLLVIYITTLTKMRQVDQDNKTANTMLVQTNDKLVKVAEENTKLKKGNGALNQTAQAALDAANRKVEGLTRDLNRTCQDTRCLMAAVDLLDKMAPSGVDPCEDFWTFSCGTWIAETEIPESREAWGLDTETERVCMEKIRKDLNSSKRLGRHGPVEEKYSALLQVCMKEEEGATGEDNPLSKILSHWNICHPENSRSKLSLHLFFHSFLVLTLSVISSSISDLGDLCGAIE